MAWTHVDNFDKLPNINARAAYQDGVLKRYNLYPLDGYVLHIPSGDSLSYDEEDNLILDENGNAVIMPYYTWGGATASANYDFVTNPEGYEAVPYEEGMTVFGTVDPPHEIA